MAENGEQAPAPTSRAPWWRRWWMIVIWAVLGLILLMVVCSVAVIASMPEASAPAAAPTPPIAEVQAERAPTWEQCQPFAENFHDADRRFQLAAVERNYEVHPAAQTLEHLWQPVVVDHAEAELGRRYAEGTGLVLDAAAMMPKTLEDMPDGCHEYPDQWDAIGAAMVSPTWEGCHERRAIAREAIPEYTRYGYSNEASDVLDKLRDESSGVDAAVAYEVLGELIYADHLQMQEAAKASLISLCGPTEWQKAAEELSDSGPQ